MWKNIKDAIIHMVRSLYEISIDSEKIYIDNGVLTEGVVITATDGLIVTFPDGVRFPLVVLAITEAERFELPVNKVEAVGQKYLAASINMPVTCIENVGEGGSFDTSIFAVYAVRTLTLIRSIWQ